MELFNRVMLDLGYDPSLASTDTDTPEGIGTVSADALLNFRRNDGSNQLNGYEDTTDYQPVNSPDELVDLNRWQPLRQPLDDPEGTVQKFLTPQWGEVIPFALESGDQFLPPAPKQADSVFFQQRVGEILNISANLTDEQRAKIDAAREKFFDETRSLRRDIDDQAYALRKEMTSDNPDSGKVAQLQKQLSKLEAEFDQKKVQHQLEMRKLWPEKFKDHAWGRGWGNRCPQR
jgi:Spy/CpxP family protein refolding chaperone